MRMATRPLFRTPGLPQPQPGLPAGPVAVTAPPPAPEHRKKVQIMKASTKLAPSKRSGRSTQPHRADRKSSAGRKTKGPSPARAAATKSTAPKQSLPAAAPRQSKQAAVVALLRRPEGVTIAEIVAATGWQPHTVRGLFSGTLKKKQGLSLSSAQEDHGRVYRISDAGGTASAGAVSEDARGHG
jgi:Protein of unknown function (DUF3489)